MDGFGAARRTTEKAAEQDTDRFHETRGDASDFIVVSDDADHGADWIVGIPEILINWNKEEV